jgi:hypothetical protein
LVKGWELGSGLERNLYLAVLTIRTGDLACVFRNDGKEPFKLRQPDAARQAFYVRSGNIS